MPKKRHSSSSDDSDEEANIALLREAADLDFINDDMFKDVGSSKSVLIAKNEATNKSQRYIEPDDSTNNDLNISESMQAFVYKKMTEIIRKNVEFIDVEPNPVPTAPIINSVKLLSDSDPIVLEQKDEIILKRKRPKIIKRKLEEDISDAQKLKEALTSAETISSEVRAWKDRSKVKNHFHYKEHQSKLHLIEPPNEFTKQRKKNNWSENKIAKK